MSVQPVILAAGNSERMGFPKPLLPLGRSTFLETVLSRARRCVRLAPIVVLGRFADRIRPTLPPDVHFCLNPDPDRGQFSSLLVALDQIADECRGCLVWPVDQPLVLDPTVERLVKLFEETDATVTLPICGGRRGHPAVFHRRLFQELKDLGPLGNPKPLILWHSGSTALFETDDMGTIEDIDTPQDYKRLVGESLDCALRKRGPQTVGDD
jgi:molybdenum cofactor cytidylyltransferase